MMPAPAPSHAQGSLTASFKYAINGVLRTLCTQRNMKIHWVSGTAVMLVGMALELDVAARAAVLFCVFLVVAMEVLNTALESFVDLHVKQYAHHAMVAKDAAAAAVLVLAVCSLMVFADVLFHQWSVVEASGESVWRTVTFGVPLLAMLGLTLNVPYRPTLLLLLGAATLGCLAWLSVHAEDIVFSLGALLFVVAASIARLREPGLVKD